MTKVFAPKDPRNKAQGQSAEWVVERANGETLMNFGRITFTNVAATTEKKVALDVSGATAYSLQRSATDPTIIAPGSILDSNTIQVTYTGP